MYGFPSGAVQQPPPHMIVSPYPRGPEVP
ncbi:hypothetical protein PENANT_c040G05822 [Penicillium antarcticum]|uniref:Uncharacterized protein n=1 Tax=Penicillium antarcticum TaxID=416450 RepID=A0A1V6PU47_9EURO|nr:hypothetical protein PENANT_c040G05822 [Penicillium antarcticum]